MIRIIRQARRVTDSYCCVGKLLSPDKELWLWPSSLCIILFLILSLTGIWRGLWAPSWWVMESQAWERGWRWEQGWGGGGDGALKDYLITPAEHATQVLTLKVAGKKCSLNTVCSLLKMRNKAIKSPLRIPSQLSGLTRRLQHRHHGGGSTQPPARFCCSDTFIFAHFACLLSW